MKMYVCTEVFNTFCAKEEKGNTKVQRINQTIFEATDLWCHNVVEA